MKKYRVGLIGLMMGLGACSNKDPYADRSVSDLYNEAMDAYEEGNYPKASKIFGEVERQHPYSPWAAKALIMGGYAHYKNYSYDEAVAELEKFIELSPGHPLIRYAYYLRALCFYERVCTPDRDPESTRLAMEALQTAINQSPDSPYSKDLSKRLLIVKDHMAERELAIAAYYKNNGNHTAAIKRLEKMLTDYPTTRKRHKAENLLSTCYENLGIHYSPPLSGESK